MRLINYPVTKLHNLIGAKVKLIKTQEGDMEKLFPLGMILTIKHIRVLGNRHMYPIQVEESENYVFGFEDFVLVKDPIKKGGNV